jgi:uncharacterized membrane protein
MVVGTAIFGIVSYALDSLLIHTANSSVLSNSIFPSLSGTPFNYISTGSLLVGLTFTIPLFFAVEFGPWVGLVVAAGGALLADSISTYISYFGVQWYWYLGFAVLGFVSGLALVITRRRYNTVSGIVIAILMSAVATFLYYLIGISGDSVLYSYVRNDFGSELFGLTVNNVICLILLLILLLIYNAVARKKLGDE